MRLTRFQVAGFRGVAPTAPVDFTDLGHLNVLIGPNNVGKSSCLSLLHWLRDRMSTGLPWIQELNENSTDANWWFGQERAREIAGLLEFATAWTPARGSDWPDMVSFAHEGIFRISFIVQRHHRSSLLCITPHVWVGRDWKPLVQIGGTRPSDGVHLALTSSGVDFSDKQDTRRAFHEAGQQLLHHFANSIVAIDAVRALDRHKGTRGTVDGSALLESLMDRERDKRQVNEYNRLCRKIVGDINSLLDTSGGRAVRGFRLTGRPSATNEAAAKLFAPDPTATPEMQLEFEDHLTLPLTDLGTGVSQLVLIVASILERGGTGLYVIEEPECHLHPALLKRFLNYLASFGHAQFLLSTHSNVVLDALTASDRVFRLSQSQDRSIQVHNCRSILDYHQVLDDLGATNSSLLQANCIIFTEGPSDRLILNTWLKQTSGGAALIEGIDYAFFFYGGRLLSHIAFHQAGSRDESADLLELVRLARHCAVVMDRDDAPGTPATNLNATKRRILAEAAADPLRRLAVVTVGREIENELPADIIQSTVVTLLGITPASASTISLTGHSRYWEEIPEQLGIGGAERDRVQSLLRDKMRFMRTAMAVVAPALLPAPAYMVDVRRLIDRARGEP